MSARATGSVLLCDFGDDLPSRRCVSRATESSSNGWVKPIRERSRRAIVWRGYTATGANRTQLPLIASFYKRERTSTVSGSAVSRVLITVLR